jgi:hypothetical protein
MYFSLFNFVLHILLWKEGFIEIKFLNLSKAYLTVVFFFDKDVSNIYQLSGRNIQLNFHFCETQTNSLFKPFLILYIKLCAFYVKQ